MLMGKRVHTEVFPRILEWICANDFQQEDSLQPSLAPPPPSLPHSRL